MNKYMSERKTLNAVMLYYFAACSFIMPLMTIYLREFLNSFQIGIVMAVTPVTMMICQPLWGIAADRWKTKKVLIITLLLTAVSAGGFLAARSFWSIISVFAVYSIFVVSLSPLIDTLTLSICRKSYGSIRLWGSIGYGAGVFLSGVFKSRLLGFWSFIIHMLFLLVTLFLIYRLPETTQENLDSSENLSDAGSGDGDGTQAKAGARAEQNSGRFSFIFRPKFILLLFALLLIGSVMKGFDNFFPVGITDLKASDFLLGSTWIVEIVPEIILFYYLDRIVGKISAWKILIIGTIAYAVRMALLGCFPILWVWIATQPISSLAFTFWYFGAVSIIRELTDARQQATGQTIFWSVSYGIGGVGGSLLSGYIADTSGIPAFFRVAAILCIVSALVLIVLSMFKKRNHSTATSLQ